MSRICPSCGDQAAKYRTTCSGCARARFLFRKFASGQYLAMREVYRARAAGELPPASSLACVDCGAQAAGYDHRDYNAPLAVEPVCRKCNSRRGAAAVRRWTFDEFAAWFASSKLWFREETDAIARIRANHFTGDR